MKAQTLWSPGFGGLLQQRQSFLSVFLCLFSQ